MIKTIEITRTEKGGTRTQTIKCGPITVLAGPSGTGKTRILRAIRQAYTKEGNCAGVKLTNDRGRTLEAPRDGGPQAVPDFLFDPLLFLDPKRKDEVTKLVRKRAWHGIEDRYLLSMGVPEADIPEFKQDPDAYALKRTVPKNTARIRQLEVRREEIKNFLRLLDSLRETDELLAPFQNAQKVTPEQVREQEEATHRVEDEYRQITAEDPDKRRTLFAEVIRNRDLCDELRRGAKRHDERTRMELRRASIQNLLNNCKMDRPDDASLQTELDTISAEVERLSKSGPGFDMAAFNKIVAPLAAEGYYSLLPGLTMGMADGVFTYEGVPLTQHGKSLQMRACTALVGHLIPDAKFMCMDNLEALGVPDGVSDYLCARRMNMRKGFQIFATLTLDDRNGKLSEFTDFLNQFRPEVSIA